MTGPLSTKADMDFFTSEEAKRIQESWEPKFGDWVLTLKDGLGTLFTPFEAIGVYVALKDFGEEYCEATANPEWYEIANLIFLPRQGQLQAMLEERVDTVGLRTDLLTHPPSEIIEKHYHAIVDKKEHEAGPTPSIALGRALLEAIQRRKK